MTTPLSGMVCIICSLRLAMINWTEKIEVSVVAMLRRYERKLSRRHAVVGVASARALFLQLFVLLNHIRADTVYQSRYGHRIVACRLNYWLQCCIMASVANPIASLWSPLKSPIPLARGCCRCMQTAAGGNSIICERENWFAGSYADTVMW